MKIKTNISIFDYLDYRSYLRDWYEDVKRETYGFSLRIFSQKAGFGSSNILKLVMDGDRNLTLKSIRKFVKGLEISAKESKYFRLLVMFNQAKAHAEKDEHYKKIIGIRNYQKIKPLESDQYEYCAHWYHSVVRELAVSPQFNGDYQWIAERIKPRLTEQEVETSLLLLERLELVKRSVVATKWELSTPLLTTGAESNDLIMKNFHLNVLNLLKTKFNTVEPDKRDISAMTLGIVRERLPQLKKMIQDFRAEVLKLVADDKHPEEVMMLTMQLFPVTVFQEPGKRS